MAELHIIGQILGGSGFNSQTCFVKVGRRRGRVVARGPSNQGHPCVSTVVAPSSLGSFAWATVADVRRWAHGGALPLLPSPHLRVSCCLLLLAMQWGVVAGRSWELLEGLDQGQTQVDKAPDGEMVVWAHPLDVHYACRGLAGWPKLHFQVWNQDVHGRNDLCEWGERVVMRCLSGIVGRARWWCAARGTASVAYALAAWRQEGGCSPTGRALHACLSASPQTNGVHLSHAPPLPGAPDRAARLCTMPARRWLRVLPCADGTRDVRSRLPHVDARGGWVAVSCGLRLSAPWAQ